MNNFNRILKNYRIQHHIIPFGLSDEKHRLLNLIEKYNSMDIKLLTAKETKNFDLYRELDEKRGKIDEYVQLLSKKINLGYKKTILHGIFYIVVPKELKGKYAKKPIIRF